MRLPWFLKSRGAASNATPAPAGTEAEVQYNLGVLYSEQTQAQDLPAALECFRKAAELGHAGAQNSLGLMLGAGQGTSKDPEQARSWFMRAANQGLASAQFNLAARCHRANMRGLTEDASEGRIQALMWFQLAANQGYPKAHDWCERLQLDMAGTEVAVAARRAVAFVARKEELQPSPA
jgi:TPR repeat protein